MIEPIIRDLTLDEWNRIAEAFHSQGSPMPDPQTAVIRVAIDPTSSKIMGFVVVQKVLTAQPAFVYPEFQHQQVIDKIYESIDKELEPGMFYFVTIQEEALVRRASHKGFIEIPGTLMGKVKAREASA